MIKTVTHTNNIPFFGDEPLIDLAASNSFSDLVFEMFSGKKPTPHESELFSLILNCSIDHGPDTPSAKKTIESATQINSISDSVAEGIKQINDSHGGAIEPAMELLYNISKQPQILDSLISSNIGEGKRIAGYGHRLYDSDPRAQKIIELLKKFDPKNIFISQALEIERKIAEIKNKPIPLNIDGAIAVVLCSFGWNPKAGKAVFIVARTPGLCAHWLHTVIR